MRRKGTRKQIWKLKVSEDSSNGSSRSRNTRSRLASNKSLNSEMSLSRDSMLNWSPARNSPLLKRFFAALYGTRERRQRLGHCAYWKQSYLEGQPWLLHFQLLPAIRTLYDCPPLTDVRTFALPDACQYRVEISFGLSKLCRMVPTCLFTSRKGAIDDVALRKTVQKLLILRLLLLVVCAKCSAEVSARFELSLRASRTPSVPFRFFFLPKLASSLLFLISD